MVFNVFGRLIAVERQADHWIAFHLGAEGKRRPAPDLVIPSDLVAEKIGDYLDELCHEWATAGHPEVRRIK